MNREEIKKCIDIGLLEMEQEEIYRDCVRINNCEECFHKNDDDICDLELITGQIDFVSKR